MDAALIDERHVVREGNHASFVAFIYEGGEEALGSWSVAGYLLTDADLPEVLAWLAGHLPVACCWSLAVVEHPERPTADSELAISWVVGSDVLNTDASQRTPEEQRLAEEMVARRHRLTLA